MVVAAIGVGMLLLTLIVSLVLRAHALRLANLRGPTAQASTLALQGVQRSLAGLRGWITLGENQFRQERQAAWEDDLDPSLAKLSQLSADWTRPENTHRLAKLQAELRKLREAQWWIEDVAQTPGNEPARVQLDQEVSPTYRENSLAISSMIEIERTLTRDTQSTAVLGILAELHHCLDRSWFALREFVNTGSSIELSENQLKFDRSETLLNKLASQPSLLTVEQVEFLNLVQQQLPAFKTLAQETVKIRQSKEFNVANHLLRTEAVPTAGRATELLHTMSENQEILMEEDAERVKQLSNMSIGIGVLLIGVMILSAMKLSRSGAARLAAPIDALSQATRELSERRLDHDIPVTSKDELGVLTTSFNSMRRALEMSEGNASAIIESTPACIVMTDEAGRILLANSTALQSFGYQTEQLIGQKVDILVPENSRGDHKHHRWDFAKNPSHRPMGAGRDLLASRRDGSTFPVEVALTPLETPEGPRVLATVIDITFHMESERRLREQAADLTRSNEELNQFAYVASHDLKSPLRAIKNLAQWVAEDSGDALPEDSRSDLTLLQERVTRMELLLDSLLDYSRVGRKEDNPEAVNLRKLLDDLAATLDVPPGFKIEIGEMPTLRAPRGALLRVFGNLISNGIKHHDREEGTILISCHDEGTDYRFTVQDDGPGIPPEFHERIFEMFQTLRPRDEVEGTGMGLSMVKKTIEVHGGRITLTTPSGKGTAFSFTWPANSQRKFVT